MDTYANELDRQVSVAFDSVVKEATNSVRLGRLAMQPEGVLEETMRDLFKVALTEHCVGVVAVSPEARRNYPDGRTYRHDIVVTLESGKVVVVEVKTPFTNQDGITSKTRKSEQLPKDLDALKAALDDGAFAAYELIVPVGCYPVYDSGEMVVLEDAIRKNEKAVKKRYKIQWPTRKDYKVNGRQEVDRAIGSLAAGCALEAKRIEGWTHIDLPRPRPNIHSFVDCALYKVWRSVD